MTSTYDEDTLYVDNSLAYLIAYHIYSDYLIGCDMIIESSNLDKLSTQMVNLYNDTITTVNSDAAGRSVIGDN